MEKAFTLAGVGGWTFGVRQIVDDLLSFLLVSAVL